MIKYILFFSAIVILLIAAWYFLWHKPNQNASLEGKPCKVGLIPGKYKDGVCVATPPTPETLTL